MDAIPPSDPSHYGMVESSPYRFSHDRLEEASRPGSSWYFSRKEIEENSPSRRDGIDLKKETYLRKSYCTYLQDLGMRLKVPQVTIATAIVFCHRFFLRQSHLKNDRRTIATVCMFLAGKVEETPRPLKDVILVSYEVIHKKDPAAAQRIKQREVYEQQKELILLGERVVLATLGFDFNVHHPYKPLVEAIKKFKVAQNALAQVAWNFVNDGLRTSLCLQFKPHHIAAGAIFLAAKFLKVKLPSDGEKVWWQEFDVTPRQLEEVSNQMLELYEQNRLTQQSHGNETEGSSASGAHHHAPVKAPFPAEEPPAQNGYSQATKPSSLQHSVPSMLTHAGHEQSQSEKQNGTQRLLQNENNDYASNKLRSGPGDSKTEAGTKDHWHHDQGNVAGTYEGRSSRYESECPVEESTVAATGGSDGTKERTSNCTEGPKNFSPMMDAMKKIDKDKVKAALEKRRKSKGDVARKIDLTDEDDLIERELEHGVELAVEDEKIKQERRQSWSKTLYREGPKNSDHVTENGNLGHEKVIENTEEGELSMDSQDFRSPEPGSHKRKAMSPGKQFGGRDGYDAQHYNRAPTSNYHDGLDDARSVGRFERAEREHKRFRHES
ncbi:cyclin-T1-3-like isoform X1 [Typha latifolia]|uniref:cyclin-T1-3-like isoform X1 n=1 Tax=Typha latifolia TaxID=4733 RepID=UPI003C2B49DA